MLVFYPWNVYAAEPATDIDSLLNEQTSKQRKNGEPDIETTCIRIHVVFTFCLQFCLCICICCCFKRRWIQFTKMPGGRRGLVAPQNTFLENIIRRSNSQRKYLRFSFLSFFLCRFYHSYTHLCVWYDYEIVNGWTKEEAKTKIKRNPMNMSSKVKRKNLEPTTEKKEKEKLWIIKNSVKSPIELTLTANAKKSWRKLNGKYIVTSDGKNLRVGWTFCCCFFVVGKGKVCI